MSRVAACASLLFVALAGCSVYEPSLIDARPEAAAWSDARSEMRGDAPCEATDNRSCVGFGGAGQDGRAGGAGSGGSGGNGGSAGNGGSVGSGGNAGSGGGAGNGGQSGAGSGGRAGGEDAAGDARSDAPDGGASRDSSVLCDGDADDAWCDGGATPDADGGVVDRCPDDPLKTDPGSCGCGVADTDSDGDATADCIDGCATDPRKTQAGICGCNATDPSDADAGAAFCLKALLAHRYSFDGTGTAATDSIAAAHGAIMGGSNASMSGGSLTLSGDLGARYTNEGYVSLPSNLLEPLTNATLEAWVTWRGTGTSGNAVWQRIFDFGSQITSGSELVGNTYLFLTPRATSSGVVRVAYTTNGSANETIVNGARAFPLDVRTHVAVVVDDANDGITLYVDGSQEGTGAWNGRIVDIDNVNSWLGRSNYGVDPEFNGILHEFRVYRVALTAAQVRTSFEAGPDPAFF